MYHEPHSHPHRPGEEIGAASRRTLASGRCAGGACPR